VVPIVDDKSPYRSLCLKSQTTCGRDVTVALATARLLTQMELHGRMTSNPVDRESRRSTRVRLKVRIEALGVSEPLTCEGETFVVNLHGALILTAVALRVGMKIGVHVLLTGKRAIADVVYVDPEQPRHCGIIWKNLRTFGGCRRRRMIGMRVTQSLLHSVLNCCKIASLTMWIPVKHF